MPQTAAPQKETPLQRGYVTLMTVLSYAMCIVQIGYFFVPTVINSFGFCVLHFMFGSIMCYMIYDAKGKAAYLSGPRKLLDLLMALVAVAVSVYIIRDPNAFMTRIQIRANTMDVVMGVLCTLVVLEACRRMTGPSLPIVALLAIAYALWGGNLPGVFAHKGYSIQRVMKTIFSQQGIFGSPLTVCANTLFMFLLFGAFLNACGADVVFKDLSIALAGKLRGGPAKIAVVASCIFGSISGSPIANVASTGAFTIPLMKRQGYRAEFAGAVEAVASTGGQIMPPVMGAAAFLLSDMVGVSYSEVCIAAMVPAVMYYVALFIMVDVEAIRAKLKGLPQSEIPALLPVLRRSAKLLVPIVVLIGSLVFLRLSATKAAIYATVAIIICSLLDKADRFSFQKLTAAFVGAAKSTTQIFSACCTAGIVIGLLSVTGLGLNLSNALFRLGGESILLCLMMAMVVSIILGMGLPASAAYIITATTMAAPLIKLGLPVMSCHLFLLYFACASNITPPVAIASYAGAAIADAPPMKVSWEAVKLGVVAFIVPYAFVLNPLIIQFDFGTLADGLRTLLDFGAAVLASFPFAYALQGFSHKKLTLPMRAAFLVMGVLMISTLVWSKLAIVAFVIGFLLYDRKKNPVVFD